MGAWKMLCSRKLIGFGTVVCLNIACLFAVAQAPAPYANVGKTPTPQEIQNWDIAPGTEGKELPPGSGTAKQGAPVFMAKCAPCHGRNLEGTPLNEPNTGAPPLVGGMGSL